MTVNGATILIFCFIGAALLAALFVLAPLMLSSQISADEEAEGK